MAIGKYDYFRPTEKGVWVRFNPKTESEYFEYEVYDRETKEVKTVRSSYLEHRVHWVRAGEGKTPRSMVCSAGVHLNQPCWGHAFRHHFFEQKDALAKETGVRDTQTKSPVSEEPTFAFNMTIMEPIYIIPKLDGKGQPVKNQRTGQPITVFVPESLMGRVQKGVGTAEFGKNVHFSCSQAALGQVLDLDDQLNSWCLNCAKQMLLNGLICSSCETLFRFDSPLQGEEMMEALEADDWVCNECSGSGGIRVPTDEPAFVPDYRCQCGKPAMGNLSAFDVKLKQEKSSDAKKRGGRLKISQVRMPKIEDAKVAELLTKPLDLKAIFAPTPLSEQAKIMGTLITGLSPEPKKRGEAAQPPAEPYGDGETQVTSQAGDDDEVEDDLDDAHFNG